MLDPEITRTPRTANLRRTRRTATLAAWVEPIVWS
jgi:hypothetical protein